jgi:hypothetical protein
MPDVPHPVNWGIEPRASISANGAAWNDPSPQCPEWIICTRTRGVVWLSHMLHQEAITCPPVQSSRGSR